MTFNEYQVLASRTMNPDLGATDTELHALHGLSGEVGELHSIYQKRYQGHLGTVEHKRKEAGDILWMLAEYCTANGFSMDDIAAENIDKLKNRYPDGFSAEKSLNRAEGDI